MAEDGTDRSGTHQFPVKECATVLKRLSALTGMEFCLKGPGQPAGDEAAVAPIRLAGRETGWFVSVREGGGKAQASVEMAADLVGMIATAENDLVSLSRELAECYEELNFLYDMSAEVGTLLDERRICEFVAERLADMLECDRASVMLLDRESNRLRILGAVGLAARIVEETEVKPGEGISGRALVSGKDIIVKEGDPLPPDALRSPELQQSVSFLCIPLRTSQSGRESENIGVINLTRKRGGGMFTSSDLKLVKAASAQTATQIHNCRLLRAEHERRELERELQIAAQIQLGLLPTEPLRVQRIEAAGLCRQARKVGGDFFDYWQRGERISLVVADVCGHELGAALLAAELRSVLRSQSLHSNSVKEVMGNVNTIMFDDLYRSELLITLFYAEIDPRNYRLTYSRAGHPRPLLVRRGSQKGRQICWLDAGGPILGLEPDLPFGQDSITLEPGDTLVVYSDGVVEVSGPDAERFGTEGVLDAAVRFCHLEPAQLAAGIVDSARQYASDNAIRDDMTVLALRLHE